MLEYTDHNACYKGSSFYHGYCEGLLSVEAETIIRIARSMQKDGGTHDKVAVTLTEEFVRYLKIFMSAHAGQPVKNAAKALWKESEYLPSYLAYSDAESIRKCMETPVIVESEGAHS